MGGRLQSSSFKLLIACNATRPINRDRISVYNRFASIITSTSRSLITSHLEARCPLVMQEELNQLITLTTFRPAL